MRTVLMMITAVTVAASCAPIATPPPPADLPAAFDISRTPDQVWPRLIGRLSDLAFSFDTSDRAGGIIRTDWRKLTEERNDWLVCGKNAAGVQLRVRGEHSGWMRLHVTMVDAASSGTTLRLRPEYQLWYGVTSPLGADAAQQGPLAVCQTTGVLERALVEHVRAN